MFHIILERTKRDIPEAAHKSQLPGALEYRVRNLVVPGDLERHNLMITFKPSPPQWAAGIPACDYPSVFTDVDRRRLHVNGDTSLCLWAPHDPPERRWWHRDGLHSLVEIVRRHLLFEIHWSRTGGPRGGEWPVEDAPHGRSAVRSAS